jgi:hypothetical protein
VIRLCSTGTGEGSNEAAGFHGLVSAQSDIAALLDHLVGGEGDGRGEGEAERFRRLDVDDELEFRALRHPQIGGLVAFQDARDIAAGLNM